ncbi:MAG: hypothetical protein R2854_19155 [Caldilineaceae bacterium]
MRDVSFRLTNVRFLILLVLFGIALPGMVWFAPDPAYAAADAPADTVYLPYIAAAPQATPAPTATAVPTPDAPVVEVFVDTRWKTSNAAIQVDNRGALHVAYYYYEPQYGPDPDGASNPTGAVYLTCAARCDDGANWAGVSLGERVNEVQLALTADGRPRLLYRTWESTVFTDGRDYVYAACDVACTEPANWTETVVASSYGTDSFDIQDDNLPQRSFALDPQGRPHFVYLDRNYVTEPDRYGLYYLACDAACTDAANWTDTLLTAVTSEPFDWELVKYPTLTFTAAGEPRLVSAEFFPLGEGEPGLTYFACDTECDDAANWGHVRLADRGQGSEPSVDLALDHGGRPRLAFYQESIDNVTGQRLYYLWCDGACLDADNWQQLELGLGPRNGQEPDIALDGAGRPRIAYADYDVGGLGYAWCDGDCTTAAGWQHVNVETSAALAQVWPVAYPPHCDAGLWDGMTPSLALDRAGLPWVAYDTVYNARCWYNDDSGIWEPDYRFHLVMRAVRVVEVRLP